MADGVEDGDQRGAGQHGIRQVQRVGIGLTQRLQQADHVIAERPEQAGGHGRQVLRQVKAAGRHQTPQRRQGIIRLIDKPVGRDVRATRQRCLAVPTAPDDVGIEGQDRIAALDGAPLDRLEQEGIGAPLADLQIGRDRGLQIVDPTTDDDLGSTRVPGPGEGLRIDRRTLVDH